jgi:hypothetical protein
MLAYKLHICFRNCLKMIYIDTSSGFLLHLRCVAITLSPVQVASLAYIKTVKQNLNSFLEAV